MTAINIVHDSMWVCLWVIFWGFLWDFCGLLWLLLQYIQVYDSIKLLLCIIMFCSVILVNILKVWHCVASIIVCPNVKFKEATALMDIDGTFLWYCPGVWHQAGVIVGPYVLLAVLGDIDGIAVGVIAVHCPGAWQQAGVIVASLDPLLPPPPPPAGLLCPSLCQR